MSSNSCRCHKSEHKQQQVPSPRLVRLYVRVYYQEILLCPGATKYSPSPQGFSLVHRLRRTKKWKKKNPTSIRCCRVKLDKDFTMLIWALFKSHDQYTTHDYKRGGKHSSTSITYKNHRNSPCICYLNAPSTFLLELSTEGQCFVDYRPWQPWKESLSLHGKKPEATQFQLKLNWLYELWINRMDPFFFLNHQPLVSSHCLSM